MILFCPRCGAELGTEFKGEWWSTSPQCLQCGVALTEPPAALAPSERETEYVLDAWPPADRAVITAALDEAGFPYRWSAGLVLTVPEPAEDEVNTVLGELSEGPVVLEVDDEVDGEPDDEPDDEAAGEGDGEADEGDGGEEAFTAMTELFLAADRLQRTPSDASVVFDLVEASEVVGASRPPYGIEREVWGRIQQLAAAAAESGLDQAGDETVTAQAAALRDFLRAYV